MLPCLQRMSGHNDSVVAQPAAKKARMLGEADILPEAANLVVAKDVDLNALGVTTADIVDTLGNPGQ